VSLPLATVEAIWAALSPDEKRSLVQSLVDAMRGKSPKGVRIAALREREILALAKVAERLKS